MLVRRLAAAGGIFAVAVQRALAAPAPESGVTRLATVEIAPSPVAEADYVPPREGDLAAWTENPGESAGAPHSQSLDQYFANSLAAATGSETVDDLWPADPSPRAVTPTKVPDGTGGGGGGLPVRPTTPRFRRGVAGEPSGCRGAGDEASRSLSAGVVGAGRAWFEAAVAQGHEGVVAKFLASPYHPGRRSPAWKKIKPKVATSTTRSRSSGRR